MPGRRLDRRHRLARGPDGDAVRPRVHRDEARRRRLGARRPRPALARARDPPQRALPGLHRHAARPRRAARSSSTSPLDGAVVRRRGGAAGARGRGDAAAPGSCSRTASSRSAFRECRARDEPARAEAVGRVPAAGSARLEHARLPRHRAGGRPCGDRVGRDARVLLPRAERADRPRRHGRGAPRHGDGRRLLDADERGRGLPHRRPPHRVPPLGAARARCVRRATSCSATGASSSAPPSSSRTASSSRAPAARRSCAAPERQPNRRSRLAFTSGQSSSITAYHAESRRSPPRTSMCLRKTPSNSAGSAASAARARSFARPS